MKTLLLFIAGIVSFVSFGQDGSLDTSFGDGGIVVTDFGNSHDFGRNVVQQNDGKIILSGARSTNNYDYFSILVRYLEDGSIDSSFGTDGLVSADFGNGYNGYQYLFIGDQEKITAAGSQYQNQDYVFIIVRYLPNGQLDDSFGVNGIVSIPGSYNMMLLADGSFLLLRYTDTDEIPISHYLNDGTLDTSFGVNGTAVSNYSGENFTIRETKVDEQGNIYLLGKRDNTDTADIILMKFLPTGYLDVSFGNNGMAMKTVDAPLLQSSSSVGFDFTNDGKIVIAGSYGGCIDIGNPSIQPFFIRFLSNGLPDGTFGNNGTVLLSISSFYITQLIIQENQRMIVIGNFPDCFEGSIYAISRYFPGGTVDNSFNGASLDFDNYKTILQEDGKIVSVGNTFWYTGEEDIVLVRHNNDALSTPDFENQKTTIYPNPSNGIFTVKRNFYSGNETYQITDITGKIISIGELNDTQSQIDISAAQSGVYFLKTSDGAFRLLKN